MAVDEVSKVQPCYAITLLPAGPYGSEDGMRGKRTRGDVRYA